MRVTSRGIWNVLIQNTQKIAVGIIYPNVFFLGCFLNTFRSGDGMRKWKTKYFMGMLTAFNSIWYRFILRRPSPKRVRTFVLWRYDQIFSAWWVTNFRYPWCFLGALHALKLRYEFVCRWHTYLFTPEWVTNLHILCPGNIRFFASSICD